MIISSLQSRCELEDVKRDRDRRYPWIHSDKDLILGDRSKGSVATCETKKLPEDL